MKPLDPINVPQTAIAGVAVIVLSILANPQAQAAIVSLFSHPTVETVFGAIGTLAGVILLYIAKPLGTSSSSVKGP